MLHLHSKHRQQLVQLRPLLFLPRMIWMTLWKRTLIPIQSRMELYHRPIQIPISFHSLHAAAETYWFESMSSYSMNHPSHSALRFPIRHRSVFSFHLVDWPEKSYTCHEFASRGVLCHSTLDRSPGKNQQLCSKVDF